MAERLDGFRILILEAREEAQFSRLLAGQGAQVVQCPMFAIHDAPDPAPVEAWIGRCIANPFDDLVLTTGEGLRRLVQAAKRIGAVEGFVAALGKSRTVVRGPKPGRALREIGLAPSITTAAPTSEGIVAEIEKLDLHGRRVGLQLYPDKDHAALIGAIKARGAAVDCVLPYVYDPQAAEQNILDAIAEMDAGKIDCLALTSSPQVRRLIEVARAHDCEDRLRRALQNTTVAAVGPVVAAALKTVGVTPGIAPANEAYFMKPLISAMATALVKNRG